MLHKNVIENKGGFRPLSDAELGAVSGGNSFTSSFGPQEGNQIFAIRSASSFVQSLFSDPSANIGFLTDLANSNQNFIDPGLINAAIAGVANQASSADESDGGDAGTQPEGNSEDFVDEDGDAALLPQLNPDLKDFDLSNFDGSTQGIAFDILQPTPNDGSQFRGTPSDPGTGQLPVDVSRLTDNSASNPPSLNQSGGITGLPIINLGSGVRGGPAFTGSPTNPTGVGVSGSAEF